MTEDTEPTSGKSSGGAEYIPVFMSRMSGHHAGGEMLFERPDAPIRFRIIINGLPNLNERVYEW